MSNRKIVMTEQKEQPKLLSEFPKPSYEEWRAIVDAQLKGAPFEKKLVTQTPEGINLQPIYVTKDAETQVRSHSFPGSFPFTRGTKVDAQSINSWLVCQGIPYPSARAAGDALRHDIKRGANSVRLVLDQASQSGMDPDHAPDHAKNGVGSGGTSLCAVSDFEALFKDIDLTTFPLVIEAGEATFSVAALFVEYLHKVRTPVEKVRVTFVFDPLAAALSSGSLLTKPQTSIEQMAALIQALPAQAVQFKVFGIDARPYAEAGGNAVQELAYALSAAVQYLRLLNEQGIDPVKAQPQISFHFAVGSKLFMEIAKLRAARILWAQAAAACGCEPKSATADLYACSLHWNKTKRDPYVNMLRTTTEAFAAVVGGADGITTAPFDLLYGSPDEFSRRIARNTQLVLNEESRLQRVIDPSGGSYYVETLTSELTARAWKLFQEIEQQGGLIAAIEAGSVQAAIATTQKARMADISQRKEVIVGTTMYADVNEKLPQGRQIDCEKYAAGRVQEVRNLRKSASCAASLKPLQDATKPEFSTALKAASEGATLGELHAAVNAKSAVSYKVSPLHLCRAAEEYEALRERSDRYRLRNGQLPSAYLATMGPLSQHKPRADFSRDFFEPGGYRVISERGFETAQQAAEATLASGAELVVLCSTDETYPALVAPFCEAIKKAKPNMVVVLAGYPTEHIEGFTASGIDDFIHIRANNLQLLTRFHQLIGA